MKHANSEATRPRPLPGWLSRTLGERNRRVAAAAAASVLQRAFAIVGTFVMFPRVLTALGTDQFGLWGAATSLTSLVSIADLGIGSAILTLVAHGFVSSNCNEAGKYFATSIFIACLLTLLIGSGGSLAAVLMVPRAQLPIFLVAVASIAINVPLGTAQSGWLALQKGWIYAFWEFVQTALLIGGLLAAVHYTRHVLPYVAAIYGALLLANATSMIFLISSHPELRPHSLIPSFENVRRILNTGFRYFLLSAFDMLSYVFDNVLALQLLGTAASARMAIVQRICLAALGLLLVIAQPLWPAFVEAAARGDRRWISRALARGSLLVTGAAISGSLIIVGFGGPLLNLWLKRGIGMDQRLLWVMAIWIVSVSLVRVSVLLLNAMQIVDFQIGVFAVATFIALPLKFILAPRYGIAGILMATAVTYPVIVLPAILWRIGRLRRDFPKLRIRPAPS